MRKNSTSYRVAHSSLINTISSPNNDMNPRQSTIDNIMKFAANYRATNVDDASSIGYFIN